MTEVSADSFDPFSTDVLEHWAAPYRELRDQCPVHRYSDDDYTFFTLSKYDDVKTLFVNHSLWTIERGQGPGYLDVDGLTQDPPDNAPYRRLVAAAFSNRRTAAMEPVIHAIVDRVVAELKPLGRANLFEDFAAKIPTIVVAHLLGLAEDDIDDFVSWTNEYKQGLAHADAPRFKAAQKTIVAFLTGEVRRRRDLAEAAPDDLLTEFAFAQTDSGDVFPIDDIGHLGAHVLIGAHGTVIAMITNMVIRLLEDRSRWERLLQDRSLVDIAVEESLRFDPPSIGLFRTATRDTCIRGVDIPEQSKVMGLYASANRDEDVHQNPDEFSLDRDLAHLRSRQMAFGAGAHLCPGASLGRLQGRIALTALLDNMPNMRLESAASDRIQPFFMWSFANVPVCWEA
jgi:cytochrome P450